MKEFLKKNENLIYTFGCAVLSFAIPLIITIILFTKMNFTPFGDKSYTVMMFDMQSQYVAYMRYYRECLLGNVSAIYTHTKVFGGDFMSIFCYYLASPFNYFVVFVKSSDIPQFFAVTSLIKISLAGLMMYICLRFTLKKNNLGLVIPAIGYGLISYSFLYLLNFMWLDGVMILPIIILGINKLAEGKGRWIYPLGLAYALMTSWYIGAMICIFAVIYYVYKVAAISKTKEQFLSFTVWFAIFSVIGGLFAAPFWMTAFLHLGGTKGSFRLPTFDINYVATFFEGFLENSYVDITYIQRNTGYISMFTSVVTLVFFQLFFFNTKYTIRERLVTLGLPSLFFVVYEVTVLNALFHGGRTPTWFPTRYSFLIGFIICYFAGFELAEIKHTNKFGTIMPFVTLLLTFLLVKYTCNDNGVYSTLSWPSVVIYVIVDVLASVYLLVPEFKNSYVRYAISMVFGAALIALTSLSSYRGSYNILKLNLDENEYEKYETYLADEAVSPAIDAVKSYDSSVYRMETLFDRPGTHNTISNNPLFYSYNGLNHFSSSEKEDCMEEMLKFGFHYNHFFEKYDSGSTVAINSFLGMKYLVDNKYKHMYMGPIFYNNYPWSEVNGIYDDSTYKYYENALALPFAFTMRKTDNELIAASKNTTAGTYYYDRFDYQNNIYKELSSSVVDGDGNQKDILNHITPTLTSMSDGMTIEDDYLGNYYVTGSQGDSFTLSFTVPTEAYGQNLYFVEQDANDNFRYYIDNNIYQSQSYWHKGIRGFYDISSHEHELRIVLSKDMERAKVRPVLAWEDMSVLKEYVNVLKKEGVNNARVINGLTSFGYEGDFELNSANRDLITTIPYEGYWKVFVDGKAVKTQKRLDIFLSADLSNVEIGTHHIKIVYSDKGLILSCVTASFALATSVALFGVYTAIKKKKPIVVEE